MRSRNLTAKWLCSSTLTVTRETKLLKKESPKEQFLERLAAEFSRKEYLELAASLKIKEKSAEGYITDFVKSQQIERTGQGHYKNLQTLNP